MDSLKKQLLSIYHFSPNIQLEHLRESSDNAVYLITDEPNKYILRISKKKKENNFLFETELLARLYKYSYPVAQIIKTKNEKDYFQGEDESLGILFEYIDGKSPCISKDQLPSLNAVKLAASNLADLHNLSKKISLKQVSFRTIFYELEKALTIKKIFISEFEGGKEFVNEIEQMLEWGYSYQEEDTILHNDFRPHNLIFSNKFNELKAVIDFDWSCKGPAIKDLAQAACEWSFPDGAERYDEKIFTTFVNSYNQKAVQQHNDLKELYKWVAFASLSDSATYFYDRITSKTLPKKVINSYMYKKYRFFKER